MACSTRLLIATLAFLALGSGGCSSSSSKPAEEPPPPYLTETMAALFDNSIEPTAVGLGGPLTSEARNILIERAQSAEFILPARVATVTTKGYRDNARYNITLKATGASLNGAKTPSDTFSIVILPSDTSFHLAESRDMQLVGTKVIAMLHRFSTKDGPVLRWYLAPDTEQVTELIRQGLLLSTVAGDKP